MINHLTRWVLILMILFDSAAAAGAAAVAPTDLQDKERVSTRGGLLVIRTEELGERLMVNDRMIIDSTTDGFDLLRIHKRFRRRSSDVFLIGEGSNGSHGCQEKFLILELTTHRRAKVSRLFGTCASGTRTRAAGSAITVDMPVWRERDAHEHPPRRFRVVEYRYQAGKVSKPVLRGSASGAHFDDCWEGC
jgi:hypothetical protein